MHLRMVQPVARPDFLDWPYGTGGRTLAERERIEA